MMLGRISGSVTTKDFSFKAEAKVKKLQYVSVKDFEGKWILGYVDSITNYMNSTLAKAKVIGFRDSRNFLKPLPVPFEPNTPETRAAMGPPRAAGRSASQQATSMGDLT